MRLWTTQGIAIYEQLQNEGIAYCTKPACSDAPAFIRAYHWMAEQMRRRIGEPPVEGIEFPLWAWYQYNSAKNNKPPRSPHYVPEGISAYMEIDIPDKEVLLSDFISWHSPLNEGPLNDWKRIFKETDRLDKEAGRLLSFDEYPLNIQKDIEKSWEGIFDLDTRNKDLGRTHKRNRSIQATFWALKPEYIVSVEFLERKGDVVKTIQQSTVFPPNYHHT